MFDFGIADELQGSLLGDRRRHPRPNQGDGQDTDHEAPSQLFA
jgi:hypothetical protein